MVRKAPGGGMLRRRVGTASMLVVLQVSPRWHGTDDGSHHDGVGCAIGSPRSHTAPSSEGSAAGFLQGFDGWGKGHRGAPQPASGALCPPAILRGLAGKGPRDCPAEESPQIHRRRETPRECPGGTGASRLWAGRENRQPTRLPSGAALMVTLAGVTPGPGSSSSWIEPTTRIGWPSGSCHRVRR